MRYLFALTLLVIFLTSCGTSPVVDNNKIPEDLEAKRIMLKRKRAEIQELNDFVAKLEEAIETQDPSSKERKFKLVTAEKVTRKNFERFVEIQGLVQTDDIVNVSSEIGGRIIKLPVEEGQYVKKGQLIAELDLESVDKQIAEIEKSLELATEVYDRQKRLWDQEIGSEIQYLKAKNDKERLEKSLETIRFQLEKGEVFAPISGVIDILVLKNGEVTAPGSPIVQILNTSKVKVEADVPENYLQAIRKGELVTIDFPALNRTEKARVSLIGRKIDPGNRTFKVEADVSNKDGLLKPNLLATMLVKDFSVKDAIVIPLELVQQEVGGKDFVYVKGKKEEGLFAKKVYVKTGESYDGEIIVEEGLNGDEDLIIEGARGLANNELIKIQNEKNPSDNG